MKYVLQHPVSGRYVKHGVTGSTIRHRVSTHLLRKAKTWKTEAAAERFKYTATGRFARAYEVVRIES